VTLVVIGGGNRRERAAWERERTALLARMDTVLEQSDDVIVSLRGELDGLAQALRQSQASVRNTRGALERLPSQSGVEAEDLRRELRSATEALSRQQLAASLDFKGIERANRPAVAMIHVESDDGTISTASAFAVRAGGMLVTAAHVLRGANGARVPRRIGVQFSDSRQVFPARLAAYATDADIAVITVDNMLGEVPVIAGFNTKLDTLPAGAPVAIIGFPLDGDVQLDNAESRGTARPLMTAAILTRTAARTIELQGYGAAGASGSPVFDAAGNVVGVLSGGTTSEGRRLLVAVPSAVALALISRID
jgi:S1-C subfamily serine protease